MWIRSQDYRALGDYNEFYIVKKEECFLVKGFSNSTDDSTLKRCNTEEEANGILDRIMESIINNEKVITI